MAVPPMMFQKLRRQEAFEACPSCHRILYYELPTGV
jgi:predicted  nucleic acid-binding Zn-ribbon protein